MGCNLNIVMPAQWLAITVIQLKGFLGLRYFFVIVGRAGTASRHDLKVCHACACSAVG